MADYHDVVPGKDAQVPEAQSTHVSCPEALHFPAAQREHVTFPPKAKVPASQDTHVVAPLALLV